MEAFALDFQKFVVFIRCLHKMKQVNDSSSGEDYFLDESGDDGDSLVPEELRDFMQQENAAFYEEHFATTTTTTITTTAIYFVSQGYIRSYSFYVQMDTGNLNSK